jgi:ABC-type bacteriocin/lantibiotic exporter with double-glycine peptidase domain
MVLIMRALMRPKPIVIMDEPTTAIDAENKTLVIRAVKLLCENATVIIVTHERELLSLVDRVVTIKSGKS